MKRLVIFLATVLFTAGFGFASDDQARLLRFPAIHRDTIVFCYAGDLYTVPAEGGVARRLTSHDGYEMFPRFSPDGETIAFTGQYDGNTEVFTIPASGGEPKRLTWTPTLGRDDVSDRMGPNNIVMGWKSDGSRIVFRSRMNSFNDFQGKLYTVSSDGGPLEELPLPRGGFCSFSPEDDKLAYNRVFREFRTWKRYRGGMADDIWIYDFNTKQLENITDNAALDLFPMWKGDKIYFVSDRDKNKRINLYVYEFDGQKTRRLTDFAEFDIKFPSLGDNAIVFENGGWIYRFDLEEEKCTRVEIQIREDLPLGRTGIVKVSGRITSSDISPDGKRAVFGARGDVFTVPAKHGEIRNLTKTPGVHERNAVWSPDGKWIAWISDATGEDEIYIAPQDGSGQPKQLTRNGDTYLYGIVWSPDSGKILWSDRRLRLRFVNVEDGGITDVDQAVEWEFGPYVWSPDSQWIAFVRPETETMSKIYLYSLADRNSVALTDGWFGCDDPAFSSDGRYIFFVSDRDFNPIYGSTEWNHIYLDMSRIYMIPLAKDVPNPFAPKSDEVEVKKDQDKPTDESEKKDDKSKEDADKKDKGKDKKVEVRVDRDGLSSRIVALPVPTSRYSRLISVEDTLYYARHGSRDGRTLLFAYDLKERKETELGVIGGYDISADRKKMLVQAEGRFAIIDLPKGRFEMKDPLELSEMEVVLDRRAEWKQIYWECWRQMRDFFYVPNLHGVDWKGMGRRYEALLPFVNHRADLTYIIGELIGELNAGHTYVGGGDFPHPDRISLGLLGAKLQRDDDSGFWKIERILPGQNWDDQLRSPLMEVGVDARQGDFILSIDGAPANVDNIYKLLVNKAGKQVVLKLNEQPNDENARTVTVIPIASEQKLYYFEWVQRNIDTVNKATDGKCGYLHVPDMSPEGLNEFVKYYYPQIRKKALIIDVRGNGGGNVSPMLIERLRRQAIMIDVARGGQPHPDPDAMIWGPMACLCDEYSASDGDLFSYRFKQSKLGKLIGKRTWGGVVGIRGTLPLLDGGVLNKPEFSRYDLAGRKWIIEGHGVDPDIVVDNDPAREYAGVDDQLNKAIEVILEELKTKEKTVPALPPYPVK